MAPSRRKVLFIASAYPRFPGDIITPWLGETIARLRDAGVDVSVLAPAWHGGADQVVDGVKVHRFRYAPAAWEMLSHDHPIPWQISERPVRLGLVPGYVVACALAATRIARAEKMDVIHAFWPLPHSLPGMFARRAAGVPLVSTFFGSELHWLAAKHEAGRKLVRAIVRGSDAVTAISAFTARELTAIAPAARPEIVPFGGAVSLAAASPRAPFASGPARFLFVGRLVERKGVDVLLAAFMNVPAPATLTIVGDGADRARLEALAQTLRLADRVTFTGQIAQAELERQFAECDALILPAVTHAVAGTEGLGVVLIEAMGHGRPVIASDTGGITDVVEHEHTGLLVPPGDDRALTQAMRRLIDDPALAQRLGSDGRRHAESRFSWARIVDQLVTLYDSVIRR